MRGKTCVITGATSGIGLETAKRLGALGARLVLVGRDRSKGQAAIARLRAEVPNIAVEMHYADLLRPDEIRRLTEVLLDTAARIDVLLNNAVQSLRDARLRPMDSNSLLLSIRPRG